MDCTQSSLIRSVLNLVYSLHFPQIIVAEAAKNIRNMASRPVIRMSSFEGPLSTPRLRSHSDIPSFKGILSPPSGKVKSSFLGSYTPLVINEC